MEPGLTRQKGVLNYSENLCNYFTTYLKKNKTTFKIAFAIQQYDLSAFTLCGIKIGAGQGENMVDAVWEF